MNKGLEALDAFYDLMAVYFDNDIVKEKYGITEKTAKEKYKIVTNNKNYTIYQLDIGSLLSGTKYRGELEEKVVDVIESIKGKNNIIFIK